MVQNEWGNGVMKAKERERTMGEEVIERNETHRQKARTICSKLAIKIGCWWSGL